MYKVAPHLAATPFNNMVTVFWPEQKLSQSFYYLRNPFNMVTALIQLDFCGPLVTSTQY